MHSNKYGVLSESTYYIQNNKLLGEVAEEKYIRAFDFYGNVFCFLKKLNHIFPQVFFYAKYK